MKEEKLVKKAKNGHSEAFDKLYEDNIEQIYRFIYLRVRRKDKAEDITQKVFIKAWKNISSYESQKGAGFHSWLYQIAKNAVIDHYRTNKDHLNIDEIPEDEVSTPPDKHKKEMDKDLKFEKVMKALEELTENQQNVIVLKFIEELSNKEIADILNKSEVSVRVTQHRGLKKLKKILNSDESQEDE
ncbi:MAG: RNA polymerase sigma factor [Candidatus Magasanikbacteria bacterium]